MRRLGLVDRVRKKVTKEEESGERVIHVGVDFA